jgi:hypothetical protein
VSKATWTTDVSGKQDYDGSIVVFSTRYYPPHKQGPNAPKPHSVMCGIYLNYGDEELADTITLADTEVWGDTEAEAKALAEEWVDKQAKRVRVAVMASPAVEADTPSKPPAGS